MRWLALFVLPWAALVIACVPRTESRCRDGRICAPGTVCDEVHDQCLRPGQLVSCRNLAPQSPCRIDSTTTGLCLDGICVYPTCGDGQRNQADEVCDGADLGGLTCQTYGWYQGYLGCPASCADVVEQDCADYCGDGVINGSEQCDGLDQSGESCISTGALAGALGCNAFCQTTVERCHWGRAQRVRSTTDQTLSQLWASGPDDVWAGGVDGTLVHYDGTTWRSVDLGTRDPVRAIWGSGPDDVWVAIQGTLHHFIDPLLPPMVTTLDVTINAIWGAGERDVWAVGDDGVILHHDGEAWREVQRGGEDLQAIAGTGASNVWAVGHAGRIEHHDGGGWRTVDAGLADYSLMAVWTDGHDDVWVVGGDHVLFGPGVAVHFDGAAWSPPIDTGTREKLFGVFGHGDVVWIAGNAGVLRVFDGDRWRALETDTSRTLYGVWATGIDNVWAAGEGGMVLHYDGPGWTPVASGTQRRLASVWAAGPDDAWAVGMTGTIVHFDGVAWAPASSGTGADLAGVWGSSADDVWAVGEAGTILHHERGSWRNESVNSGGRDLAAVWGSGRDDVWAAGDRLLLHRQADRWTAVTPAPTAVLTGLWGSGPDDIWAVGAGGVTLHYDGGEWQRVDALTTANFLSVWGSGPGDVWALADDLVVRRHDGTAWTTVTRVTRAVLAAWGSGPNNIWFVGSGGTMEHHDGTGLHKVESGTTSYLLAVAGSGAGDVWTVATDGTIYHLDHDLPMDHGGACPAPVAIYCGSSVHSHTHGAAALVSTYGCAAGDTGGGEVFYKLANPVTGTLTVRLRSAEPALQLVALHPDGQAGCDLTSCAGLGALDGSGDQEVTVRVSQGDVLYVVVDGPAAAPAAFELDVTCVKELPRP